MKISRLFTVRNESGQLMGRYRALTAQQAITRFLDEQAIYASTFRRSHGGLKFPNLTATVED